MTTLLLTRGIPGSGKTTWAKAWVAEHPSWRIRVNRDDLRYMGWEEYVLDRMREDAVTTSQQSQVAALLKAGVSVVVDDTNLRAETVRQWQKIAANAGAKVEYFDFPISLDEALRRNKVRSENGGRFVPESVIKSFYDRFTVKGKIKPVPENKEENFIWAPYKPVPGTPRAILVDIDGTIADMEPCGRSPYDVSRVDEDVLKEDVANVVKTMHAAGVQVIFMSGRNASCRSKTIQWLLDHEFVVDHLYMRAEDDPKRKDSIVKYELFNHHIRNQFNIIGVFDDRKQVVEMWRAIGLTVFQVDWGDF